MSTTSTKNSNEPSLLTDLAGIQLQTCLWNASGPHCTTESELMDLAKDPYTAMVVSKSTTLAPRDGNPGIRYAEIPEQQSTINSTGLANLGYQFYNHMAHVIQPYKPYTISVSGMNPDDNLTMIHTLADNPNISAIELNLSCPNLVGKPQIGYDFEASRELLRKVYETTPNKVSRNLVETYQGFPAAADVRMPADIFTTERCKLGLKLPPYLDPVLVKNMSEILDDFPIDFITCINSLGNGLYINYQTETPLIQPKRGLGGIGGMVVKPFALANVWMFYQEKPELDIIGCGGVITGVDAFEHILVGAKGVAVGSTLMREGPGCFKRISQELKELMIVKGYRSLNDFRGQLKAF